MADDALGREGLQWYEVSNWARGGPNGPSVCRHNLGYWHNDDWWGIGPGAHSRRQRPLVEPQTSCSLLPLRLPTAIFRSAGSELLTADDRSMEDVMLRVRLPRDCPSIE